MNNLCVWSSIGGLTSVNLIDFFNISFCNFFGSFILISCSGPISWPGGTLKSFKYFLYNSKSLSSVDLCSSFKYCFSAEVIVLCNSGAWLIAWLLTTIGKSHPIKSLDTSRSCIQIYISFCLIFSHLFKPLSESPSSVVNVAGIPPVLLSTKVLSHSSI